MDYDFIIKNGKIINGAGNPWYYGEIGINEGKIVKIGTKIVGTAREIIDASNEIVSPGFIDIHSHSDYILLISRNLESTLHQGITTNVVGMCGLGMAPIPEGKEEEFKKIMASADAILGQFDYPYHTFTEYLEYLQKKRPSANLAFLVGYENLRFAGGQGRANRDATQDEMERMKSYLREAMEAGAFGIPVSFSSGAFHPRCFGTYPRILGKYVREEKLLTLEQAIRKMTSFPAQRLGLQDRGLLLENYWADIVIFNPDTIIDKATYEKPYQIPEGISYVLVNGQIVIKHRKQNKKKPGVVIKRA